MLALHYYSNAKGVRATLRKVTGAWWSEDDDPVYSKDLIKEFEVENPPLEDELAWILKKGTYFATLSLSPSLSLSTFDICCSFWGVIWFQVSFISLIEFSPTPLSLSLSLSRRMRSFYAKLSFNLLTLLDWEISIDEELEVDEKVDEEKLL